MMQSVKKIIKVVVVKVLGRQLFSRLSYQIYLIIARFRTYLNLRKLPQQNLLLQIGCGYRPLKNWVNLDKVFGYADIVWNVTRSLPFKSNSVQAIFCEHVIEHLNKPDGFKLVVECFRVLQPGGVARFSTPDAEKYLISYTKRDSYSFIPGKFDSNLIYMDVINMVMRENGEHHWVYDRESIYDVFRKAGFNQISHTVYGESIHVEMNNIDSPERAYESLYIEAVK